MAIRQIKIALSLVVILAAGVFLFSRYFHLSPRVDPRPHHAIGTALATRVVKELGPGGRITLITPDTVTFKYPGAEIQLAAFYLALGEAKQTVAVTNVIKLDPLFLPRVPPGLFADILRKQSDADVVVSLLGPPAGLTPEHKARQGDKRPRIIALCSGDMPRQINLAALFADGLLHAALIPSARPVGSAPASDTPAEWLNHFFQWITAQNVGALSAVEMGAR